MYSKLKVFGLFFVAVAKYRRLGNFIKKINLFLRVLEIKGYIKLRAFLLERIVCRVLRWYHGETEQASKRVHF
jgi:hypothetical protein